ncbi:hypothetical protein TeGR_g15167 [Tetraparma gracilis]|uniref:G-protein coupled receptors family 1 profile domain-containing protein n=1 Tax=Tetraparma gracilis TaxID=2962635 RepID=A0ABQ6MEW4_9STRA|nr:hypothetical protein TeGR_g15167 [Tetraparma gracilis]
MDPISPSSFRLTLVALSFCLVGLLSSSLLLLALFRDSGHSTHSQRHGQILQASSDLFFFLALSLLVPPSLLRGGVPSPSWCAASGALIHFASTAQFSCITGLVLERHFRLRCLRDCAPAATRRVAPHWRLFKRAVLPLLLLHALLPVLTNQAYGLYEPKPNNVACYASSDGRIGHGLFAAANDLYFLGCFLLTVYTSSSSLKIVRSLLSSSSSSTSTTRDAARAERRAMWFAVTITLLFLLCWSPVAVYFALLPFSAAGNLPPLYFDLVQIFACCTTLNSFISVGFDPGLRKQLSAVVTPRSSSRKIGPSPPPSAAGQKYSTRPTAQRASKRRHQKHMGSRVSHFEEESVEAEEERREADRLSRLTLQQQLFAPPTPDPSPSEEAALQSGRELVLDVDQHMEPRAHSNGLVRLFGCERDGALVLKAVATVRTSPSEVASFLHDFDSRYFTDAAGKDQMVRDRYLLDDPPGDRRSHVSYTRYRMPGSIRRYRDRVVVAKSTCSKQSLDGSFLYVTASSPDRGGQHGDNDHVLASCSYIFRIKQASPVASGLGQTLKTVVELYARLDFSLNDSQEFAYERVCRPLAVRAVSQVQRYYQNLRALDDLDADDGAAMGTMLLDSVGAFRSGNTWGKKKTLGRLALSVMLEKNRALRELHSEYAWFAPMMVKVLDNRPGRPKTVDKPLGSLTEADGRKLGKTMGSLMLSNRLATTAVHNFIRRFPCLTDFDARMPFFRAFMEAIAHHKRRSADWGVKIRVLVGVVLPTVDMSSDVYMVTEYIRSGEIGMAKAIIAMVFLCLLSQLMIVYAQTRRKPALMVREMLLTLLFMKPARDALRVAQGNERKAHEAISPFAELMSTKMFEVGFESIPGSILQTSFLGLQTLSFDQDVDPQNRRRDPLDYGFVPDKNRDVVQALLLALAASTMVSQIFNYVLLMRISVNAMVLYWLVPMCLFIGRKLARKGDFQASSQVRASDAAGASEEPHAAGCKADRERLVCCERGDGGGERGDESGRAERGEVVLPFGLMLIWHIVVKSVTDISAWTLVVRTVGMGGAGYSSNFLVNQGATYVVAYFYVSMQEEEGLSPDLVWRLTTGASVASLATFAGLLFMVDRDHLHIFFSFERTRDQVKRLFYFHDEPELKLIPVLTWYVAEESMADFRDDVKEYIQENLETFEKEKPLWWTDDVIAHIPTDMLEGARGGRGVLRRKESGRGMRHSLDLKRSVLGSLFDESDDEDDEEEGEEEEEEEVQ